MYRATLLALLATTCGGAGGGSTLVVVTLDADAPGIAGIAQLFVSATDGQRRAELTVPGLGMLAVPPTKTVGLTVPEGTATLLLQVEALDAAGATFAFGEGTVAIAGAGQASVTIKLQLATPPPRFSAAATIPPAQPGTRLKPTVWEPNLGAGPPLFAGWADTLLGIDCSWQVASDGTQRCLPDGYTSALAYADPQCRTLVTIVTTSRCNPTAELPAYGTFLNTTTCPTSRFAYRKGAQYAGMLYTRTDTCVPAPALRADQKSYAIELVPPATFVGATASRLGQGAVAAIFLDADDGARLFSSWRSAALDSDCQVRYAADGKARCLPLPAGNVTNFWADAACMRAAASGTRSACGPDAVFVASVATGRCPAGTTISRAAMKVTTGYRRDAANVCSASTTSSNDFYTLDAEVTPATLDEGAVGVLPATGRLRPLTETTAGGTLTRAEYWDAKLRVSCSPGIATDGRTHCLPATLEPPRAYTQADCAGTQVVLRRIEDCDRSYTAIENTVCPVGKRIFALAAQPYTGLLWSSESGRCEPVMARAGFQAFAVGPETPATDFVELKRSRP